MKTEFTLQQKIKFSQAIFTIMQNDLSEEGNDHLDIKLNLQQDTRLSEVENLKIRVVTDVLAFYDKYPTLHALSIIYNKSSSYSSNPEGWYPSISQLAWDSVKNLQASEEYKKMNVNMYAFCNNSMNDKKSMDIVPFEGGLTSKDKMTQEFKEHFKYLYSESGTQLYQELQKQRIEYKGLKDYISLEARNWYGWKNLRLKEQVKEFLGEDMLSKIMYFNLDDGLKDKSEDRRKKKI